MRARISSPPARRTPTARSFSRIRLSTTAPVRTRTPAASADFAIAAATAPIPPFGSASAPRCPTASPAIRFNSRISELGERGPSQDPSVASKASSPFSRWSVSSSFSHVIDVDQQHPQELAELGLAQHPHAQPQLRQPRPVIVRPLRDARGGDLLERGKHPGKGHQLLAQRRPGSTVSVRERAPDRRANRTLQHQMLAGQRHRRRGEGAADISQAHAGQGPFPPTTLLSSICATWARPGVRKPGANSCAHRSRHPPPRPVPARRPCAPRLAGDERRPARSCRPRSR